MLLLGGGFWYWQKTGKIQTKQSETKYPTVKLDQKWSTKEIVSAVTLYRQASSTQNLTSSQQLIISEILTKSAAKVNELSSKDLNPGGDYIVLLEDANGNSIEQQLLESPPIEKKQTSNLFDIENAFGQEEPLPTGRTDSPSKGNGIVIKISGKLPTDQLGELIHDFNFNNIAVNNRRIDALDVTYLKTIFGEFVDNPEIKMIFVVKAEVEAFLIQLKQNNIIADYSITEHQDDLIIIPARYTKFDIDGKFAFHESITPEKRDFLKKIYPKVETIYGERPEYKFRWDPDYDTNQDKIKVLIDHTIIDNAAYIPIINTIAVSEQLAGNDKVFAHELIHSFYGLYTVFLPVIWNEGLTCSVAENILFYDNEFKYGNRIFKGFQIYESGNIGTRSFNEIFTTDIFTFNFRGAAYKWGVIMATKFYIENNNFYRQFNQLFYSECENILATLPAPGLMNFFTGYYTFSNQKLFKMVAQVLPNIEGEPALEWFKKQNYLVKQGLYAFNYDDFPASIHIEGHVIVPEDKFENGDMTYFQNFDSIFTNGLNNLAVRKINCEDFRGLMNYFKLDAYTYPFSKNNLLGSVEKTYEKNSFEEINNFEKVLQAADFNNDIKNYTGLVKFVFSIKTRGGQSYTNIEQYFPFAPTNTASIYGGVINARDGDLIDVKGENLSKHEMVAGEMQLVPQPNFEISNIPVKNGLFIVDDPRASYEGKITLTLRSNAAGCNDKNCLDLIKRKSKIINKFEMKGYFTIINNEISECCYKAEKDGPSINVKKQENCSAKFCNQVLVDKDNLAVQRCWGILCTYGKETNNYPYKINLYNVFGQNINRILGPINK